jgi:hypothetical protein
VVAVADVPGQGTAMVLTTTGLPNGFVVLLMSYAGAVTWANDVFPGGTLLGTPSLAVLPDGRIAVGGTARETGGGSGSDGYVVVFKSNGNGGLAGNYGFTLGRPSGASRVNEIVLGVGGTSAGQILLAGEATDTLGSSTDAWLAVISASGAIDASMAVGGDGDDRFVAAFEAPGNAAYLVGTTGSFGLGSTDMWGVRTLPSWRLTFPANVAGHRRVVGVGTGSAPTIIGNVCVLVIPGGVSTSTHDAAVDVVTPAFARQAP